MIDNRTVGRTIALLRQKKEMTQQQLAAALNVSHQAVSKWENGAALPDIQTMVELTQLFGVSVEQLLNGDIPAEEAQTQAEPARTVSFGTFVNDVLSDLGAALKGGPERTQAEDVPPAQTAESGESKITFEEIIQMAPFMSKGAVAEMIARMNRKLTSGEIARIAPFVECAFLEGLIGECETEISWSTLRRVAPFLKKEMVDAAARAIALGEKYVRPAAQDAGRAAGDVCQTLDDVSRRIGREVDKVVRRAVQIGENVVGEVSRAIDGLVGDEESAEARMSEIRRAAFLRALETDRWDWIEAHIDEIDDEELLHTIACRAGEKGMQEWLERNVKCASEESDVDRALAAGDWDWLAGNIAQMDAPDLERTANAAAGAGEWQWLTEQAPRMKPFMGAVEIVTEARRADRRETAVALARNAVPAELLERCCAEASEDGDDDFCLAIADILPTPLLSGLSARLARGGEWDRVLSIAGRLDTKDQIALMEMAVQNGNFDALDVLSGMMRSGKGEA